MAIRVIYMIEEFTSEGDLVMRRFARNKKIAGKIAKTVDDGNGVSVRKLQKSEMSWVNTKEVE